MFQGPGLVGSLGLLILRLSVGGMMLFGHGLGKVQNYNEMKETFEDPMELIPAPYALIALIAAELACSGLVAVGFLTRIAAIPAAFAMGVAAFQAHLHDPVFAQAPPSKEMALLYLAGFATIIFTGPGMFSVDAILFGRRRGAAI